MANDSTPWDWSTTAASNVTISGVDIAENCPMSSLNNMGRSIMAAAKEMAIAFITTGGDAYVLTPDVALGAYATGMLITVQFNQANTTTTPTLNISGLGAKTIIAADGVTALAIGNITGTHALQYDGTNFRLLNPTFVAASLPIKAVPTTADSILIQDAAAANAAKTSTIPQINAALTTQANSDTVAFASWTPVDSSGAGLSLTVSDAKYYKIGKLVHIIFNITYPVTANGATAKIGGLPAAPVSLAGIDQTGALIASATILATAQISNSDSTFRIMNNGVGLFTNANLSAVNIFGSFVYLSA